MSKGKKAKISKLPPEDGYWILSRNTQLESGAHHIDAVDAEGVPVRVCRVKTIPGTHPFTSDSANAEEDGR